MPSLRRVHGVVLLACFSVAGAACGSRGPLDGADPLAPSASTSDAAPPTPTVPPPDAAPRPTGPDLPPIVDCGICLVGECADPILACVTDTACQQAFQCVVQECGGGIDGSCILKCAQASPQGALQILSIFQCVSGKCGEDCTDLLSLLGNLGGGGGGGGGTRDAGSPPPPRDGGAIPGALPESPEARARGRAVVERAFSRWPELVSSPAR